MLIGTKIVQVFAAGRALLDVFLKLAQPFALQVAGDKLFDLLLKARARIAHGRPPLSASVVRSSLRALLRRVRTLVPVRLRISATPLTLWPSK